MSKSAEDDVARSLTELLAIARTAMPDFLYAQDPRVYRARQLLGALAQVSVSRPPTVIPVPIEMVDFTAPQTLVQVEQMQGAEPLLDITAGLDAFMASDLAPATRTEAELLILRDWLTRQGYLEAPPNADEAH